MRFGSSYPFLYLLAATVGGILSSAYFNCPWWIVPILLIPAIARQRKISCEADLYLLLAFFSLGNSISQSESVHFDAEKVWQVHARCERGIVRQELYLTWGGERIFHEPF